MRLSYNRRAVSLAELNPMRYPRSVLPLLFAAILGALGAGCGQSNTNESSSSRSYAMGFTEFPHAKTLAAWDAYAFDHPDLIAAFTAHCENMITGFTPDYFAYAIEEN